MSKYIKTILFLLIGLNSFSQTPRIEGLIKQLDTVRSIEEKLHLYDGLTRAYINVDINKSESYNDSLLSLSKKEGDKKMEMVSVYNSGVISRVNGDFIGAETSIKSYLKYAISLNDSMKITTSNYQLASIYIYQEKREEAISRYLDALKFLGEDRNERQRAQILHGIGVVYKNNNQHEKSKEYEIRALNLAIRKKDSSLIPMIYNGLGVTLKDQDSTVKALNYFEKALDIAERTNNVRIMGYQYRNIGIIHSINSNFKLAEPLLEKALTIRRKMKDKNAIGGSLSDLANVYIETNRFRKAENYLNEAIAIFKNNNAISSENTMYYYLSKLEAKRGNGGKSFDLMEKYNKTKDSLQDINLQERINDIDISYQSEKKDRELAEQKLAIEKNEVDLQKKKTQNSYMTGAAVVLLVGSILLWFLYQQRQKRKNQEILTLKREQQVQTLESLMEGEEKERLRIAKELHDGVNVDLSAIKYKLTSLLEKNNEVINEAVHMIDKSCEQVRAISHNLIPPSLKNFSLIETIEDFCATINNLHEPEVLFNHIGEPIDISKKSEVNIFRIVQELVNNSVKHANASEIAVQISHRENMIQLTVEDNGKGFDKEKVSGGGIGLQNIQSRVDYLNAKLDFNSNDEGTSYIIDINTNKLV